MTLPTPLNVVVVCFAVVALVVSTAIYDGSMSYGLRGSAARKLKVNPGFANSGNIFAPPDTSLTNNIKLQNALTSNIGYNTGLTNNIKLQNALTSNIGYNTGLTNNIKLQNALTSNTGYNTGLTNNIKLQNALTNP
jgi:hypothetical protein